MMKVKKKSVILIIFLFVVVFLSANSASAVDSNKVWITHTPTGGAANSQSTNPSVSADGRYVAYESYATNLGVGSSARGIQDIYVYDYDTNTTEWITHTPTGGAANGDSYLPSISGNGRYVTFASKATNLGPGGSGNGIKDIYVYDRTLDVMKWITHSPSGGSASNDSYNPVISADGTTIAFQSTAKNLGSGGSEYYVSDIYLYDLTNSDPNYCPEWITQTTEGKTANGASMDPTISADGRYIAFETTATNLGPNPYIVYGYGKADIFVYDRNTGNFNWTTEFNVPQITADITSGPYSFPIDVTLMMDRPGKIYYSTDNRVTWTEINNDWTIVTLTAPTYLDYYGISSDGFRSAIVSQHYLLAGSSLNIWATPSRGQYYNSVDVELDMSPDGTIYYTTDGTTPTTSSNEYSGAIKIEKSTNLKFLGVTEEGFKVKGSEYYSIIPYPIGGYNPSISADGSLVAFESGNIQGTANNIWVYDPSIDPSISIQFILITHTTTGVAANGDSNNPVISGDGRYIGFESFANNLGIDPNQPYGSNIPGINYYGNLRKDIFVYDMLSDTMNWVTNNPNNGPANGNSYTPSLNYDGNILAFSSSASNFGPGGSAVYRDIFIDDGGIIVAADKSSGTYKGPLTVTLSITSGSGSIYYTTDGSDPRVSGILYGGPLTITSDTVLRFVGYTGSAWGQTHTRNYIILKPPTVTASPPGGTYTSAKSVTLTTVDPDSTAITYYTTDGSNPMTSATRKTYVNPILIDTNTVLRYAAVDPDGNWSPNYTQTYIMNLPVDVITIAQINTAATTVRTYYENHSKRLPSSVTIKGISYNMAQMLYLLVTATRNMDAGNLRPIRAKTVNMPISPSGSIVSGNIVKTSYLTYAKSIQRYINTNGRAPNYIATSLGNMQIKYMVYMYCKIVNYYQSNSRLPNYVSLVR